MKKRIRMARIWGVCFGVSIFIAFLLMLFGRQILSFFGLTVRIVNDSIGDYTASIIGAMVGTFLAMFSAAYIEDIKEEKLEKRQKTRDLKLLICDLKTMFRIKQQYYAAEYISEFIDGNTDQNFQLFLERLDKQYNFKQRNHFEYLLSMERRADIIASIDEHILAENEKEILLVFCTGYLIPSNDMIYSSAITHRTLLAILNCKSLYNKIISFSYNLEKCVDFLKKNWKNDFCFADFEIIFDGYIGCFLKGVFEFGTRIGYFSDEQAESASLSFSLDDWIFEKDLVERLFSKDRDNLSNKYEIGCQEQILGLADLFKNYCEDPVGKQHFKQDIDHYEKTLVDAIQLNFCFDGCLSNLCKAYSEIAKVLQIDNQNISQKLNMLFDIIVNYSIPYGEYFESCIPVCNWLNYKVIQRMIKLGDWMTYKQTYFKLKYREIPELLKIVGAVEWKTGVPSELLDIINKIDSQQ